jgi:hypothetical protein
VFEYVDWAIVLPRVVAAAADAGLTLGHRHT